MLVVSGNFGGGKLRHICEVQVHLKVLKDYNRTHKVRVRVRVRSRSTSKCSRTTTARTRLGLGLGLGPGAPQSAQGLQPYAQGLGSSSVYVPFLTAKTFVNAM